MFETNEARDEEAEGGGNGSKQLLLSKITATGIMSKNLTSLCLGMMAVFVINRFFVVAVCVCVCVVCLNTTHHNSLFNRLAAKI